MRKNGNNQNKLFSSNSVQTSFSRLKKGSLHDTQNSYRLYVYLNSISHFSKTWSSRNSMNTKYCSKNSRPVILGVYTQCVIMIFAYGKELYQHVSSDPTEKLPCMWTAYDWSMQRAKWMMQIRHQFTLTYHQNAPLKKHAEKFIIIRTEVWKISATVQLAALAGSVE